jgi:hypothetical protein
MEGKIEESSPRKTEKMQNRRHTVDVFEESQEGYVEEEP